MCLWQRDLDMARLAEGHRRPIVGIGTVVHHWVYGSAVLANALSRAAGWGRRRSAAATPATPATTATAAKAEPAGLAAAAAAAANQTTSPTPSCRDDVEAEVTWSSYQCHDSNNELYPRLMLTPPQIHDRRLGC
mmetsp:Transcript_76274/g.192015  ORF Transcript_76274/g.192015 Transcript_76274/m.192015 type:complete len:134 (-) Transcript_76274:310-711(-)